MVFEQYPMAVLQIVNSVLAVIFFIFAIHTHNENSEQKEISNIVRVGLVVFVLIELIGFSNTFGFFPNIGLTHVLASVAMLLLVLALKIQIDLKEEFGGEL
jgi:heme A synthase|tara:strand:+ start:42 stop:344 length:303 start_codon:yes stop_codon:yes gene_type:complete